MEDFFIKEERLYRFIKEAIAMQKVLNENKVKEEHWALTIAA